MNLSISYIIIKTIPIDHYIIIFIVGVAEKLVTRLNFDLEASTFSKILGIY